MFVTKKQQQQQHRILQSPRFLQVSLPQIRTVWNRFPSHLLCLCLVNIRHRLWRGGLLLYTKRPGGGVPAPPSEAGQGSDIAHSPAQELFAPPDLHPQLCSQM